MAEIQEAINKGIGTLAGAAAIPATVRKMNAHKENREKIIMKSANRRIELQQEVRDAQKKAIKEKFYGYMAGTNKDEEIGNSIALAEVTLGAKKEHTPENILKEIYKNEKKKGGSLHVKQDNAS